MGSLSTQWLTSKMDELEAAAKWLTLVSTNPAALSDPLTAEIIGGTLTRHQSTWTRSPLTLITASAVIFSGIPAGAHVAGVAVFNASFNGLMLASDVLAIPADYPSGGTWVLPAGEYTLGFAA